MDTNSREASKKRIDYFKSRDVEINNIQKSMVQAIFGLTQIMGMMYSKGKSTIGYDFIAEENNTKDD
jgi:hypothetical protein